MKLTLEIPDKTAAGVITLVVGTPTGLTMLSKSVPSDDVKEGAVIRIQLNKEDNK